MSTAYHARYFAHELTRQRSLRAEDRVSRALFDAAVDLNPHQIDAASFALRSPLSTGVILADESWRHAEASVVASFGANKRFLPQEGDRVARRTRPERLFTIRGSVA